MNFLNNWFDWIVLISIIIGAILGVFFFQHTEQDISIIEEAWNDNTIILFINIPTWDEAERTILKRFPDYLISDYVYDEKRKGFWVEIKPKGGK